MMFNALKRWVKGDQIDSKDQRANVEKQELTKTIQLPEITIKLSEELDSRQLEVAQINLVLSATELANRQSSATRLINNPTLNNQAQERLLKSLQYIISRLNFAAYLDEQEVINTLNTSFSVDQRLLDASSTNRQNSGSWPGMEIKMNVLVSVLTSETSKTQPVNCAVTIHFDNTTYAAQVHITSAERVRQTTKGVDMSRSRSMRVNSLRGQAPGRKLKEN